MAKKPALDLPDQLVIRYFRAGELDQITAVEIDGRVVTVTLDTRTDRWTDLGGGLGYVPVED